MTREAVGLFVGNRKDMPGFVCLKLVGKFGDDMMMILSAPDVANLCYQMVKLSDEHPREEEGVNTPSGTTNPESLGPDLEPEPEPEVH